MSITTALLTSAQRVGLRTAWHIVNHRLKEHVTERDKAEGAARAIISGRCDDDMLARDVVEELLGERP